MARKVEPQSCPVRLRNSDMNKKIIQKQRDNNSDDMCVKYTSLAFGKRCREMIVVTSTGSAGDCFDDAMAESFFANFTG